MKKVTDISKQCYHNVVKHIKNKQYIAILEFLYISKQALTSRELSHYTKIITSTMSARINELLALKYIQRENKRKCTVSNITVYENTITREGIKYLKKLKKV